MKQISRHYPRCRGTVEDYRGLTFDIRARSLRNSGLLDLPAGYVWRNAIAWPWIKQIRTEGGGIEITFRDGRAEHIGLAWVRCGVMGSQLRLVSPCCQRPVCKLYHLDGRLACRKCGRLRYDAQRKSAKGRKHLAMRNIRRKLGDYGQLWAVTHLPKPRRMCRRTYARHCEALERIERSLYQSRRRWT